MANILYIDHYAGSAEYGRSFRPYYLGVEWVKAGHKVFVVGGTFSHIRNKQPSSSGIEEIDGITYIWLDTPKYQGNGVKRAYSMFVFVIQLLLHINNIIKIANPDVIIASSVYMLDIYPAWLMKKLIKKNTSLVFELHDLWPQTLIEVGGISKFNPFVLLLSFTEKLVYSLADKVVSILPNTLEYMRKFGIRDEQFHHIPNGVVLTEWDKQVSLPLAQQKAIDDLKREGKFLVGYAGTYSLANSLYNLIEAADICQQKEEKEVHFILIGDGPEKQNLMNVIENRKIKNVSFFDRVPKACIPTFLKQMDVLYIGLMDKEIYRYGINPNKMFDYMMSARPLLQAVTTGGEIVEKEKCGISVPSDRPDLLCNAIIEFKDLPKGNLDEMGTRGENYVRKYHNYQKLSEDFLKFIL